MNFNVLVEEHGFCR